MSRGTTFGCCKKHGDYCGSSCPFCQIGELEKRIGEIDKILIVITEGRILELESITKLKEVLRKFFTKKHDSAKYANDDIKKFYEELLEKLDVGKTEITPQEFADEIIKKMEETEKKEVGFEQSPFGSSSYTVQSPFGSSSYTAQVSGGDTSGVDKKSVIEDNDTSSLTLPNDSKLPEPFRCKNLDRVLCPDRECPCEAFEPVQTEKKDVDFIKSVCNTIKETEKRVRDATRKASGGEVLLEEPIEPEEYEDPFEDDSKLPEPFRCKNLDRVLCPDRECPCEAFESIYEPREDE